MMSIAFHRAAVLCAILLPSMALAEPAKLRLSFFTSDRSIAYQAAVRPFVDAVNREGAGIVEIEVYLSGTLGKVQKELPQLVLSDGADIAFIVPGQNPERFRDNAVIELPGLFRSTREATIVHTKLAAAGVLAGYEEFFVIGAYGTDPETIHSRKILRSIADLKGQKIRTNNLTESAGLAQLGALPTVLAFNETTPAISSGAIDGAAVPTAQLFDVGIGRIANNHFLLHTSTAPLALMMSRKAFDRLPDNARILIRKYSGEWAAGQYFRAFDKITTDILEQINSDPRRVVVSPSVADLKVAQTAFASIRDNWAAASAHNRELLVRVDTELSKLRAAE